MKKILLFFFALGLLMVPARAQTFAELHPNEISAGYSISLVNFGIGLINKAGLGNIDPETGEFSGIQSGGSGGIISMAYSRQMNPYVSLGAAASFNRVSINAVSGPNVSSIGASNLYTLLVTGKFDWYHTERDIFSMYSKIGLGAMYVQGDILEGVLNGAVILPAAQCSFICLEAGRSVHGFLELGLGSLGFAQIGVRTRF